MEGEEDDPGNEEREREDDGEERQHDVGGDEPAVRQGPENVTERLAGMAALLLTGHAVHQAGEELGAEHGETGHREQECDQARVVADLVGKEVGEDVDDRADAEDDQRRSDDHPEAPPVGASCRDQHRAHSDRGTIVRTCLRPGAA